MSPTASGTSSPGNYGSFREISAQIIKDAAGELLNSVLVLVSES